MPKYSKDQIIQRVSDLASDQFGGTLATIHADDGTPYPAFVFFHFTETARVLFGCRPMSQHLMDIQATPQVSFLIDNRNILHRSLDQIAKISILLSPIIPNSTNKVLDALKINKDLRTLSFLDGKKIFTDKIEINNLDILFKKIN